MEAYPIWEPYSSVSGGLCKTMVRNPTYEKQQNPSKDAEVNR